MSNFVAIDFKGLNIKIQQYEEDNKFSVFA